MLSAIVCPLTPRETPRALENLRAWNDETPPLLGSSGAPPPALVFSYNGPRDAELAAALVDAFDALPAVRGAFDHVEVKFCNLSPEKDLYLRDGEVRYAPYGRKAGPNWLFYETLKGVRNLGGFVLLMETDCRPISSNWLRRVQRVCLQHEDAWVVGSHYCGVSPMDWAVARHINGNALYHVGDVGFCRFLDDEFWPWLNEFVTSHNPNLAYDCGWETYLNRIEMEHAASYDWVRARDILQKFRLVNFIVNIGGAAEQGGDYAWSRAEILRRFPGAVIVHGPLASGKTHRHGLLRLGRPTLTGAARVEADRLHINSQPAEAAFSRSVWLPAEPLDTDVEIAVHYTLDCSAEAGLAVVLREPNGRAVASKRRLGAGSGAPRAGHCVVRLPTPAPYAKLSFQFHGPPDAAIVLADVRCKLSRGGQRVAATNRLLTE